MSEAAPVPENPGPASRTYRELLRATGKLQPRALFQVEDVQEPVIALTIDDGPSPRTHEILDLLERHDCRATFFVHTAPLERDAWARGVASRMMEAGHEIANHMPEDRASILLSPAEFAAEFLRAHELLRSLGFLPRFFRAARGFYHAERMLPALKRMAYYERFILGSYPPWDLFLPFPRSYAQQLAARAFPGAIFVFHDGTARDVRRVERTLAALSSFLPMLIERGYRLEPLGRVMERAIA